MYDLSISEAWTAEVKGSDGGLDWGDVGVRTNRDVRDEERSGKERERDNNNNCEGRELGLQL